MTGRRPRRGSGTGRDPRFERVLGISKGTDAELRGHMVELAPTDRAGARRVQETFLGSFRARLCALHHEWRRMRNRPSETDLEDIAHELDAWRGTDEPVLVSARPKGAAGYRPAMSFGLCNRALQRLALCAVEPFVQLHPSQYAARGGHSAACEAVLEAFRGGSMYAAELYVEACFRSFDAQRIASLLPLPAPVTEAVLVATRLNLVPGTVGRAPDAESLLREARRGLPDGSVASNMIRELLLAPVFRDLPPAACAGIWLVVHRDNVLVMARTWPEVACLADVLVEAMDRHPAGPLRLQSWSHRAGPVGRDFAYMGYLFNNRSGHIEVGVTAEKQAAFIAKARQHLERLHEDPRAISGVRALVRSWRASFRLWSDAPRWTRDVCRELAVPYGREVTEAVDNAVR